MTPLDLLYLAFGFVLLAVFLLMAAGALLALMGETERRESRARNPRRMR